MFNAFLFNTETKTFSYLRHKCKGNKRVSFKLNKHVPQRKLQCEYDTHFAPLTLSLYDQ